MRLTGRPPAGSCVCAACRDMRLALAIFALGALDKLLTIVAVSQKTSDDIYVSLCAKPPQVTVRNLVETMVCWPIDDRDPS